MSGIKYFFNAKHTNIIVKWEFCLFCLSCYCQMVVNDFIYDDGKNCTVQRILICSIFVFNGCFIVGFLVFIVWEETFWGQYVYVFKKQKNIKLLLKPNTWQIGSNIVYGSFYAFSFCFVYDYSEKLYNSIYSYYELVIKCSRSILGRKWTHCNLAYWWYHLFSVWTWKL
jgi:hypothetical protein